MSTPRQFGLNGQKFYSNIAKPQQINLNFVIDSANGNGLGQRSLKSNGYIENVYCYTSATPSSKSPAPAAGFFVIQLKNNFNAFIGMAGGFVSSLTGSNKIDNTAITIGNPYIITTLGNATVAKWQAVGVPAGVTPAVGVAFIASSQGGSANTSTSRVSSPVPSGITSIEVIGDTKLTSNSNVYANAGQYIVCQFLAPTVTAVTNAFEGPMIATQPTNNSVVAISLLFDGSSVSIDGL